MEILRLPPFPLSISYGGFDESAEYVIAILDSHAQDLVEIPVESDEEGEISTPLPAFFGRYDDHYRLEIYESLGVDEDEKTIRGDLVLVDTLTIVRPYVDVEDEYGEEEAEEYAKYELMARTLIDAITGGFRYTRDTFEVVGMGNDYLFLPPRLNKVVKVWENDILVYDAEAETPVGPRKYVITQDHSALTIAIPASVDGYNRMQSKPVVPRKAASDSFTLYNTNDSPVIIQTVAGSPMFPEGWDYVVVVETGWPVIPNDIKLATKILIEDMKCNQLPYLNNYITQYESEQYKLKFDPAAFKNTGNTTVDMILSNYSGSFYRLGVV